MILEKRLDSDICFSFKFQKTVMQTGQYIKVLKNILMKNHFDHSEVTHIQQKISLIYVRTTRKKKLLNIFTK